MTGPLGLLIFLLWRYFGAGEDERAIEADCQLLLAIQRHLKFMLKHCRHQVLKAGILIQSEVVPAANRES